MVGVVAWGVSMILFGLGIIAIAIFLIFAIIDKSIAALVGLLDD
jgi:hypothetical protein